MRWKNEGSDSWVTRLSAVVLFALLSIVGVGSSAQAQSGKAAPSGTSKTAKNSLRRTVAGSVTTIKGREATDRKSGPHPYR